MDRYVNLDFLHNLGIYLDNLVSVGLIARHDVSYIEDEAEYRGLETFFEENCADLNGITHLEKKILRYQYRMTMFGELFTKACMD